ncbi:MAG: aryl-sulfate sulfotransferase [Syntrophomonadaceae bacterium]|nr:aryl-sulfate sulfotransferase [Syntrophomonadaceae bacterium]
MKEQLALKMVNHIINVQDEAEKEFLKEYETGDFTFQNPYIKLNPYIIAPLTALVMFRTEEECEVRLTVKGKESAGDICHTFSRSKVHHIPVYGLYGDYNNTIILQMETGEEKVIQIQTEPLAKKVKLPTKIETSADYLKDNVIFVTPTSYAYDAAYDYKGDCRWYTTLNFVFDLKRISNGNLLLGSYRLVAPPYHTTGVIEMSLIGKVYKEYCLPGGYHHDQIEMEDGNFVILTQNFTRGTVEDMAVLVDRETGKILKEWDFQKVLPQTAGKSGSWTEHDWFHNNAVWYDKKTHSLTLSGRHQDIIINIDYETGELNWIIGDPEGWPEDFIKRYFFKPIGETEFDWQYEQHACMILPDGDVFVFDNGHYRAKSPEKYIPAKDNFSRAVRYRINTNDMTIQQVWQYGKERGSEFFSPYICNVEYYGEGHYLVHSGGIVNYNGVASDKLASQYETNDPLVSLNSITVELRDDKVVYEMHLPANYYRAEKMPLYSNNERLVFGKGVQLGSLGVTEEFLTEIPDLEDTELMIPEKYKPQFALEEDRLAFKGSFEKGQVVMLVLDNNGERRQYYIPTTKKPFTAMCVGTFLQEDDERVVEYYISKEGLKGAYAIYLIVENKKYHTGLTVDF